MLSFGAVLSSKCDWRCRNICPSVVYSASGDVPLFSVVNHTLTKVQFQGEKVYVQWSGFTGTTRFIYWQDKQGNPLMLFYKFWNSEAHMFNRSRVISIKCCEVGFQWFSLKKMKQLQIIHVPRSCLFLMFAVIRVLGRWGSLPIIQ